MDTSIYFKRRYSKSYDCLAFARDVWCDLTGIDIGDRLAQALNGVAEARKLTRTATLAFERIDAPIEPCLVLMLAPRRRAHVGIWLPGRVLHLHAGGVEHSDLEVASRSFKKIRFIKCKNN